MSPLLPFRASRIRDKQRPWSVLPTTVRADTVHLTARIRERSPTYLTARLRDVELRLGPQTDPLKLGHLAFRRFRSARGSVPRPHGSCGSSDDRDTGNDSDHSQSIDPAQLVRNQNGAESGDREECANDLYWIGRDCGQWGEYHAHAQFSYILHVVELSASVGTVYERVIESSCRRSVLQASDSSASTALLESHGRVGAAKAACRAAPHRSTSLQQHMNDLRAAVSSQSSSGASPRPGCGLDPRTVHVRSSAVAAGAAALMPAPASAGLAIWAPLATSASGLDR